MANAQLNTLYDHIRDDGSKSYRRLASFFKTSSSSIFRKLKQIKSWSHICGASFFESEEGQEWLSKLIVAVVMIFGVLSGVGAERLSLAEHMAHGLLFTLYLLAETNTENKISSDKEGNMKKPTNYAWRNLRGIGWAR